MSIVILTKEAKIKLLNAIRSGKMDTSEFPELKLDAPVVLNYDSLPDGELDRIIAIWEKNLKNKSEKET